MKTQHTPGYQEYPDAKFDTFEQNICATINGRRENIAIQRGGMIPTTPNTNDQETYNLIREMVMRATAAPALLAALEDCLQSLERLPDNEGAYRVTCIQQARAAIAQAKGEQP